MQKVKNAQKLKRQFDIGDLVYVAQGTFNTLGYSEQVTQTPLKVVGYTADPNYIRLSDGKPYLSSYLELAIGCKSYDIHNAKAKA